MSPSLVLSYHAVSPRWPSVLSVSPGRFREQLELLIERGYTGATFSQVVSGAAPRRSLVVSFDDGYASVLEHAVPIMRELDLPGTIFVPTDFVGAPGPMRWPGIDEWSEGPFREELRCLDWDQLRGLRDAGWEVGSHTRSHPRLSRLQDDALLAELAGSRDRLREELGGDRRSLAFPYGDEDERVQRLAGQAGYAAAASMRCGPEQPLCWPRVGVYPADRRWRFWLKTSPAIRMVRSTRLGRLADAARLSLAGGLPPVAEQAGALIVI
ncbi:MAG: polysaccharide deacetylase family protein [Actinobacteria bacterium]|nr:polysaccharide deacetylase family protein [Actinomycetota bacterium]